VNLLGGVFQLSGGTVQIGYEPIFLQNQGQK